MTYLKRFVLSGAPGSGKTAVLRALERRGYPVVEEAATEIIARAHRRGVDQPWATADFLDLITVLQRQRQERPTGGATVQFYDRSPICTLALARYLDHPVTTALAAEMRRVVRGRIYQPRVFFLRPLGFVEPTAARRISYAAALDFEVIHESAYREHGFELLDIFPAGIEQRADMVETLIRQQDRTMPS